MSSEQTSHVPWEALRTLAERTTDPADRGLILIATCLLQDWHEALEVSRCEAARADEIIAEWRKSAESLADIVADAARRALTAMPVSPRFLVPETAPDSASVRRRAKRE